MTRVVVEFPLRRPMFRAEEGHGRVAAREQVRRNEDVFREEDAGGNFPRF